MAEKELCSTPPAVIVCGYSGFLGSRLLDAGQSEYGGLSIPQLRTSEDLRRARSLLQANIPRGSSLTVINCIGMRGGDANAMNVVNSDFPKVLAEVTAEVGAHLVHLGSAAEIVETPQGSAPSVYQKSKRRGTDCVLRFPHTTVLRVFNLHGLPHQDFAGLHAVCRAIVARRVGAVLPKLFDTVRDYVHWSHVIGVIQHAVSDGPLGLREVGSGHGISLSQILESLPRSDAGALLDTLSEPDLYSSAVSSTPYRAPELAHGELVTLLAREVSECASS